MQKHGGARSTHALQPSTRPNLSGTSPCNPWSPASPTRLPSLRSEPSRHVFHVLTAAGHVSPGLQRLVHTQPAAACRAWAAYHHSQLAHTHTSKHKQSSVRAHSKQQPPGMASGIGRCRGARRAAGHPVLGLTSARRVAIPIGAGGCTGAARRGDATLPTLCLHEMTT
jgi:hypothetical protein